MAILTILCKQTERAIQVKPNTQGETNNKKLNEQIYDYEMSVFLYTCVKYFSKNVDRSYLPRLLRLTSIKYVSYAHTFCAGHKTRQNICRARPGY